MINALKNTLLNAITGTDSKLELEEIAKVLGVASELAWGKIKTISAQETLRR